MKYTAVFDSGAECVELWEGDTFYQQQFISFCMGDHPSKYILRSDFDNAREAEHYCAETARFIRSARIYGLNTFYSNEDAIVAELSEKEPPKGYKWIGPITPCDAKYYRKAENLTTKASGLINVGFKPVNSDPYMRYPAKP